MIVRMSAAQDASEAARALCRARWGDSKLRTAVGVVVERAADLDEPLREQLRTAIGEQKDADGDG
jgi:hypothetical protein